MRMFVSVAEEGSIRSGARRLLIAQPYLSQCLRKLERELGAELFVRSTRGITLTAAGELLLTESRDILARLDRVVSAVSDLTQGRRTIRIGLMAGAVAAAELTGPILTAFRTSHPEFDIEVHELTFADQFDDVAEGNLDVAIVRPPVFDPRLSVVPLFTEPRVLCMGNRHRLASAASLDAADFVDETFVDLSKPDRHWSDFWRLDELRGGAARTRPDGAVTLSELVMTLLCEDVVVTAASSAWRMGMVHPMLTAVPIDGVPPSEVALAFRKDEHRGDIRAFAECARAVTTELIGLVPEAELSH